MTYEQIIDYLYHIAPMFQNIGYMAYKKGINNSVLIDKHLRFPHTKYRTIHVAGTNGKGSTSHLLASILQEAGYRVGLYTSPHLLDFTERIKINGIPITKNFIINFISKHRYFFESIHPSFFELTTGMAFAYFEEQKIDIAIIEVGLGGRLDCTNVITPILSIITNISLDHTDLLGNTLKQIAMEKAGIIKPNIPTIIGEAKGEVKEVFLAIKNTLNHKKIFFVQKKNLISSFYLSSDGYWKIQTPSYPNLIYELGGYAQIKNATTVLFALPILKQDKINLPPKAVYKGFRFVIENTALQGRWQILQHNPTIILDIGHNVNGLQYIIQQLRSKKIRQLRIIFGMVKNKDTISILELLPRDAVYYFTQANISRALPATILHNQAKNIGLKGEKYSTVADAFISAKKIAHKDDLIFVGGSTFIVADVLIMIHQNTFSMLST